MQPRAIHHADLCGAAPLLKATAKTDNKFVRRRDLVTRNISGPVGNLFGSSNESIEDSELPSPAVHPLDGLRVMNQLQESAQAKGAVQPRTPTPHSEWEVIWSGIAGLVFLVVAATLLRFALKLSLWAWR